MSIWCQALCTYSYLSIIFCKGRNDDCILQVKKLRIGRGKEISLFFQDSKLVEGARIQPIMSEPELFPGA